MRRYAFRTKQYVVINMTKSNLIATNNTYNIENQVQLALDLDESANSKEKSLADYYNSFSPFIVYADESGTPTMDNDKNYPVFVLAFCIFNKRIYTEKLVPLIQALKFKFFGHDMVILHEKEIRKHEYPFNFNFKALSDEFLNDLNKVMCETNFILISTIINKRKGKYEDNLYNAAMEVCLVNLYNFMREKNSHLRKTYIVIESRGAKEDKSIELAFRRICDGHNSLKTNFPFEILIKKKDTNSTGLQFADLCARPIGGNHLDFNNSGKKLNRAFEVLKLKFYCEGGRLNVGNNYLNYGLNILPENKVQKAEEP